MLHVFFSVHYISLPGHLYLLYFFSAVLIFARLLFPYLVVVDFFQCWSLIVVPVFRWCFLSESASFHLNMSWTKEQSVLLKSFRFIRVYGFQNKISQLLVYAHLVNCHAWAKDFYISRFLPSKIHIYLILEFGKIFLWLVVLLKFYITIT